MNIMGKKMKTFYILLKQNYCAISTKRERFDKIVHTNKDYLIQKFHGADKNIVLSVGITIL